MKAKWKSSSSSIATVNCKGKITAQKLEHVRLQQLQMGNILWKSMR